MYHHELTINDPQIKITRLFFILKNFAVKRNVLSWTHILTVWKLFFTNIKPLQNHTFSCRKMFFAKRETNIWHASRMHIEEGQKWGISHNIVILITVITSHVSYFGEGNIGNGSTISCCVCSMNQHKKLRKKCCIFKFIINIGLSPYEN